MSARSTRETILLNGAAEPLWATCSTGARRHLVMHQWTPAWGHEIKTLCGYATSQLSDELTDHGSDVPSVPYALMMRRQTCDACMNRSGSFLRRARRLVEEQEQVLA